MRLVVAYLVYALASTAHALPREAYISMRSAASSAWSPLDLPGLEIWHSVSRTPDTRSVTNGLIYYWADSSGNDRYAFTTAKFKPPIYNESYSFFNGTNAMVFTNAQAVTRNRAGVTLIQIKRRTTGGEDYRTSLIFTLPGSQGHRVGLRESLGNSELFGRRLDGDVFYNASLGGHKTNMHIEMAIYDFTNAVWSARINGSNTLVVTNHPTGKGHSSDTDSPLNGFGVLLVPPVIELRESLVFSRAITTEEAQKIEGWGAHLHGYAAELPADHPYKDTPP